MPSIFLLTRYQVDWSGGRATPAGTAQNVRRNKPRVSEGCGLRCARGKRPSVAEINRSTMLKATQQNIVQQWCPQVMAYYINSLVLFDNDDVLEMPLVMAPLFLLQ